VRHLHRSRRSPRGGQRGNGRPVPPQCPQCEAPRSRPRRWPIGR